MSIDSKTRFTGRASYYARYRPAYPREVLEFMATHMGLLPSSVIADVGSGTGILSEMFLANGNLVYGIEPNDEMRIAAEESLSAYPNFKSLAASAEATGLATASIDCVIGGQSFHWLDPDQSGREFRRILKPGGWIAAIWNIRNTATLWGAAIERLLIRHGIDYCRVRHALREPEIAARIIGPHRVVHFVNSQELDLEGLKGRILSCSAAPSLDHPEYDPLISELKRIFQELQVDGRVTLEYDTQLYYGQPD